MHDLNLIPENIKWMLEVISRIERRSAKINTVDDFTNSEFSLDMLDAICMMLLELGESVKRLEKVDQGRFIQSQTQVPWKKIVGTRNFIGHGYVELNQLIIFEICKTQIPEFKLMLKQIIEDFKTDNSNLS